jgi:predicted dehydrogenase
MEAFHWRYHPMAARLLEIIAGGEVGAVRHLEATLAFPLPRFADIRWQLDLAGGATMDAGCYAIHIVRTLAGGEPEVVAARAKLLRPEVDRRMEADLRFPDGRTARITASMLSLQPLLRISARIVGDEGDVRVLNPLAPQHFNRIVVRAGGRRRVEHAPRTPTYRYQLEAFAAAVLDGTPVPTGGADAVANMRVIDAVYEKAGLHQRGSPS